MARLLNWVLCFLFEKEYSLVAVGHYAFAEVAANEEGNNGAKLILS